MPSAKASDAPGESRSEAREMIFAFGDCELDTDLYELRRGGVACHVEPQVFDLLLHLVKNRDRLVTRDEIYATIWKGRIVSESALNTRISAARRAIGDSGSEDGYIRTVFGRGFRLVGAVEMRDELSDVGVSRKESVEAPVSGRTPLPGQFVCYSHAWSPAFEGQLIRGSLVIEQLASSPLMTALYSESLSSGILRHAGPVSLTDRTMYLDLTDPRAESRLFLTLLCPNPRATALLGVMSGKVFHDPNCEIAVTRVVAVRVPVGDPSILDASNRYLDPAEESLSADVHALGLPLDPSVQLDALLEAFLNGGQGGRPWRVTADDNQAVNVGLDRALAQASRSPVALVGVSGQRRRRSGGSP